VSGFRKSTEKPDAMRDDAPTPRGSLDVKTAVGGEPLRELLVLSVVLTAVAVAVYISFA